MPDDMTQRKSDDRTITKQEQTIKRPDETLARSDATMVRSGDATIMRGPKTAEERAKDEKAVPLEWKPGDKILDTYEVIRLLGEGGMGKVFLVRHRGWGTDLAVKCPKAELFTDAKSKEEFITEAKTWVNIDPHPNIVSCYYVRTLGNMPRLFAECADAGSLKDWIRQNKLKDLKTKLDIAIQFAYGLDFAHKKKLIHQDVKPANVLMMEDGTAKVTDFGLAKAARGEKGAQGAQIAGGGGMTPAYASPEQFAGKPMTVATDVWSWAVSILEMFTGAITWANGPEAPKALDNFAGKGGKVLIVSAGDAPTGLSGHGAAHGAMPESIAALLRKCFENDPAKRPQSMKSIAAELAAIYEKETGEPCNREEPEQTGMRADGLNNRALSMLDLGRTEEAEELFGEALKADPHHPEATYNLGLIQWRSARITDDELVKRMEEVRTSHESDWVDEYLLGLVHMERGDVENARVMLESAAKAAPTDAEVRKAVESLPKSGEGGGFRLVRTIDTDVGSFLNAGQGGLLLSISSYGSAKIYDASSGSVTRKYDLKTDYIGECAVDRGWRLLFSSHGAKETDTMKLWNISTGQCLHTFPRHKEKVTAASVSPDGRYGISTSYDKTMRLWDLSSGNCIRTVDTSGWAVGACFRPDGRLAAYGAAYNIIVFDVASGQNLRSLKSEEDCPEDMSFSADGSLIIARYRYNIEVWEVETAKRISLLKGHTKSPKSVSLSPDARFVVSSGEDKTLRFWDVAAGQCIRTMKSEGSGGNGIFTLDGKYAFSLSGGKLLQWEHRLDARSRSQFVLCRTKSSVVEAGNVKVVKSKVAEAKAQIARGNSGRAYAIVAEARAIPGYERNPELLDLSFAAGLGGKRRALKGSWHLGVLKSKGIDVETVRFSPDGSKILTSEGGDFRVWDVASGNKIKEKLMTGGLCSFAMDLSRDGKKAIFGCAGGRVELIDVESGQSVFVATGHIAVKKGMLGAIGLKDDPSAVLSVCFTPDGKTALSGGEDGTVAFWSIADGKCTGSFIVSDTAQPGKSRTVNCVAVSPDGRLAAAGNTEGTIRIWDIAAGRSLAAWKGNDVGIEALCFTPDGKALLSGGGNRWLRGSEENEVRLWDVGTGKCIKVLKKHKDVTNSLALSLDGRFCAIASGKSRESETNIVQLWDMSTGACIREFPEHTGDVNTVSFSRDGRYLASGSEDKTIHIWELDWDYDFPGRKDWDEAARPYIDAFKARMSGPQPSQENVRELIAELHYLGFGWLEPAGIMRELAKIWPGLSALGAGGDWVNTAKAAAGQLESTRVESEQKDAAIKEQKEAERDAAERDKELGIVRKPVDPEKLKRLEYLNSYISKINAKMGDDPNAKKKLMMLEEERRKLEEELKNDPSAKKQLMEIEEKRRKLEEELKRT